MITFKQLLDSTRTYFAELPRPQKRAALVGFDAVMLMVIVWLAYCFRFGSFFIPNPTQWLMIALAPIIAIPVFIRLGLYRAILRYLPDRAVWTITQAISIAVLIWVFVVFIFSVTGAEGVPRTIPVVYWIAALIMMLVTRFGARWLFLVAANNGEHLTNTVIVGSDESGTALANAMASLRNRRVVAFISDDPTLQGMDIAGIRVHPISNIDNIINNMGVDEVIFTNRTGLAVRSHREFITSLTSQHVRVRVLPPVSDTATGRHLVSRLRDIDIADLLGRLPRQPDFRLMESAVSDKVVLITGAAGSIGSGLASAVADLRPKRLVLLDTNEHGIYELHRKLTRQSDVPIEPVLGSVDNTALLDRMFGHQAIDTIYHCAAYKHVHLAERNPLESIRNNVFGTKILVESAVKAQVKSFVLISSDKAVRPKGIMGATKRWAELIVRHYSKQAPPGAACTFATVRFGNVLGSSGSVVPLFQEQIARGGPITLTDEDMTRYFMSIPEAAELIIQAGVIAKSGDVLVLEMGEPIKIRDLAENMIMLAGFEPRGKGDGRHEIDIVVTGAQDGEKIHEELFYDASTVNATINPRILRPLQIGGVSNRLIEALDEMQGYVTHSDANGARRLLFDFIETAQ